MKMNPKQESKEEAPYWKEEFVGGLTSAKLQVEFI